MGINEQIPMAIATSTLADRWMLSEDALMILKAVYV